MSKQAMLERVRQIKSELRAATDESQDGALRLSGLGAGARACLMGESEGGMAVHGWGQGDWSQFNQFTSW